MTTALYRRYRPDSFADVIGQEHVTDPLRAALRADRATHAYLFSGPRGCGKTTSARILARCLNCAEGPTDTPCGVCDSCVELARGGPGSLDVVEIDAASHGGVDDARDLRERAVFAPARDRYKVFIIDEAHMVTPQGFNALLKLVEEPPAHVKFVFATTEPDKVIGTIRSRTHHYPFRLVPPAVLQGYLGSLCESEHIAVDSGVLPLVVRAGGGSVRDSLSVLDQLMAGASETGVSYDLASALLGFTPSTLLDDAVGALAAGDGATVFQVVDRVVESGRDPRRFTEDLLDRLRDLIVIAASGAEADTVLRALPADELERMRPQAHHLGAHRLSVIADTVNAGLTDMVGATSPRLLLELVLTRALLATGGFGDAPVGAPAVLAAPVPSQERTTAPLAPVAAPTVAAPAAPVAAPTAPPAAVRPAPVETVAPQRPASPVPSDSAPVAPTTAPAAQVTAPAAPPAQSSPAQAPAVPASSAPAAAAAPSAPAAPPAQVAGGADAGELRRRWPEVLETLAGISRLAWMFISQNTQVGAVTADSVTLLVPTAGLASTFTDRDGGSILSRAIYETVGIKARVVIEVGGPDGSGPAGPGGPGGRGGSGSPQAPAPGAAAPRPGQQQDDRRAPGGAGQARGAANGGATGARVVVDTEPYFDQEPPDFDDYPEPEFYAPEPTEQRDARPAADQRTSSGPPAARAPRAPAVETVVAAPARTEVPTAQPTEVDAVQHSATSETDEVTAAAEVVEARPVSEAVAQAMADWGAPVAARPAAAPPVARAEPAPAAPVVAHPAPAVEHPAPAAEVAAPAVAETSVTPAPVQAVPASPAEPSSAATRSSGGLPPVIDLDQRRQRAAAAPEQPPAPWEDAPEDEDLEGSVDASEVGGIVGAPLVAKMLGGVVIDEIVDGVSDLGR